MQALINNIAIEYETFGKESDPALVLVAGLGSQLITWGQDFIDQFVSNGLYVIAYDNRDVGKSTWFDEFGKADYSLAMKGEAPYLLSDMADDLVGLLKELHIDKAHVLGVSLGGMIAQEFAVRHPSSVLSLTSVMSMTGAPNVGQPSEEASKLLLTPAPSEREDHIENAWERFQVVGHSPKYSVEEQHIKDRAAHSFDRAYHPAGNGRQLAAILASGDRTESLQYINVPTVVIHGSHDALINRDGGEATAAAIPGAELVLIEGMGHHLPADAWPLVVDATMSVISRA